ncbi:MAG: DsrE family protein [Gammaproteobacteria bacterium]
MSIETTSSLPQKFLINCEHGSNDPEKATISLILAVTASKNNEAVIFATSSASELCIKGGADNVSADGYEPASVLLDAFITNGGKIWLCPACAKAKNITADDLIEGVEIAGAPRSMEYLASGGKVLA